MKRVGLREANQRFSEIVKLVRGGQEVVVTDRGKPIAVLKPIVSPAGPDGTIHRLEQTGVLRPAAKRTPLPSWTPRPLRGIPISQTLRDERDES
jgi:prevent-host-death family protein